MTEAATRQILMSDMFTSSNNVDFRRFKVSASSSESEDAKADRAFCISGAYSINDGEWLCLNLAMNADSELYKVTVSGGHEVLIYDAHATGTQDGTFYAANKNTTSDIDGAAKGTLFYAATPSGSILSAGTGSAEPHVILNTDSKACVAVKNDSGAAKQIRITAEFNEFGDRAPIQLLTYNGELLTYNGEELFYV